MAFYPTIQHKKVLILMLNSGLMNSGSLLKHLNGCRTGYSYIISILSGRAFISGMPVTVGIELTNHCNLKCPECASGSGLLTRPSGNMYLPLFEKVISELKPYLYNVNLYFQGEPMLHPQFFSFINAAKDIPLTVSTNGHFLTKENSKKLAESGLKTLIVSLDGMDPGTYSVYRKGGDFYKVKEGIAELAAIIREMRSSMRLEIQFLVNRYNEHQIGEAKKFARSVNAKLRLKSMQVINSEKTGDWMPEDEKFRRYSFFEGSNKIKGRLKNRCLRLWLNPVVTWDGKVVPCCFDKDADFVMGDLNENTFREIWHGDRFRKFRGDVLRGRNEIEICRNCTSGLRGVRF